MYILLFSDSIQVIVVFFFFGPFGEAILLCVHSFMEEPLNNINIEFAYILAFDRTGGTRLQILLEVRKKKKGKREKKGKEKKRKKPPFFGENVQQLALSFGSRVLGLSRDSVLFSANQLQDCFIRARSTF